MEGVLAFLAGLLIGSFLNVCMFRLPRDLSVVRPRSFCPSCEKQISWYDNMPVLSFLLLRGRCRNCGEPIPVRYPLVELATALVFAWAVTLMGVTMEALKYSIFGAILITLVASDIEERILPDEFTLGGAVIGLVLAWIVPLSWDRVRDYPATPDRESPVGARSRHWSVRLQRIHLLVANCINGCDTAEGWGAATSK